MRLGEQFSSLAWRLRRPSRRAPHRAADRGVARTSDGAAAKSEAVSPSMG